MSDVCFLNESLLVFGLKLAEIWSQKKLQFLNNWSFYIFKIISFYSLGATATFLISETN